MEMASSSLIERNPHAGISATSTASCPVSSRISRQWSDLNYELLVSIFSRISSVDLVIGVSAVCSSWRSAARNPRCWRVLDLSDCDSVSARIHIPVTFNKVLNRVLEFVRESERIEELYFPPVAKEDLVKDLLLVYHRLPKLLYLNFSRSELSGCVAVAYDALTIFKSLKGVVHENFVLSFIRTVS